MVSPEAPPINTFSHHCRQKYGEPVGKIPLDTGTVCPNRQNGGCIFCRPASFTPGYLQPRDDISRQIEAGKKYLLRGRFKRYIAYFQQETCTALPTDLLLSTLHIPLADPSCVGLILSTRPDHIHDDLLRGLAQRISSANKNCLFELGMQTAHDASLALLNRNHTFAQVKDAVQRIQASGPFETGVHLIFGIPGENEEQMMRSVDIACQMQVNALKIHHLQVIRDTPLHLMYTKGTVKPFDLEHYLAFLLQILPRIPAHVVLHRLWATSHPDLLVAPKWHILAADLSRILTSRMRRRGLRQGMNVIADNRNQPLPWSSTV